MAHFPLIDLVRRLNIRPELAHFLLELAVYANKKTGLCFPSNPTLARNLKCTIRTVQRRFRDAIDLDLISVVKNERGGRGPKVIQFNIGGLALLAKMGDRIEAVPDWKKSSLSKIEQMEIRKEIARELACHGTGDTGDAKG